MADGSALKLYHDVARTSRSNNEPRSSQSCTQYLDDEQELTIPMNIENHIYKVFCVHHMLYVVEEEEEQHHRLHTPYCVMRIDWSVVWRPEISIRAT